MKRTKFIAGALVLSMGLLGTGYAYWTDTLNVNATVTTAKMAVEFVSMTDDIDGDKYTIDYADHQVWVNKADEKTEAPITTPITVTEGAMTWNLSNLHPGADVTVNTKVQNLGTIPVKVSTKSTANYNENIIFNVNGTDCTAADLATTINGILAEGVDQPGESKALTIIAKVKPGANKAAQSQSAAFNLTFDVEQYNAPAPTPAPIPEV